MMVPRVRSTDPAALAIVAENAAAHRGKLSAIRRETAAVRKAKKAAQQGDRSVRMTVLTTLGSEDRDYYHWLTRMRRTRAAEAIAMVIEGNSR